MRDRSISTKVHLLDSIVSFGKFLLAPINQYLMIVSLVTVFSRRLEGSLRRSQLIGRCAKLRGRAIRTLSTYWIIQVRRVVRVLRVSR